MSGSGTVGGYATAGLLIWVWQEEVIHGTLALNDVGCAPREGPAAARAEGGGGGRRGTKVCDWWVSSAQHGSWKQRADGCGTTERPRSSMPQRHVGDRCGSADKARRRRYFG